MMRQPCEARQNLHQHMVSVDRKLKAARAAARCERLEQRGIILYTTPAAGRCVVFAARLELECEPRLFYTTPVKMSHQATPP